MAKKWLAAAAVLAVALTSGCASVQMAAPEQDTAAKTFAVKPGKANIYVYRNESLGAAVKMSLDVDGRYVGETGAKTYVLVQVDPGPHALISRAENDSPLTVNAVAGRNHFVWQEVKMGLLKARSQLREVDDATGRAGVAECSLVQSPPY